MPKASYMGDSQDIKDLRAFAANAYISEWTVDQHFDGLIVAKVTYQGTKEMLAEKTPQLQKSFDHYCRLREKLDKLAEEHYDTSPDGLGPIATDEVIQIASEALSEVFLYMGMSYAAEPKEPHEPKDIKTVCPHSSPQDIVKWCKDYCSSHALHCKMKEEHAGEPVATHNYRHLLEVAKQAVAVAKNLLQNTKQPTAKELAEEMACDMEFIQAFRDTKEMRLQRAYDSIRWLWWWGWWKNGVQMIGNGNDTYERAKELIAGKFQVTTTEITDAIPRIDLNHTPPFIGD